MPIDKKDALAFGAGAALPGAAGIQYVYDAKKARKAIKKAPSIKGSKLVKSSKVGDIFIQSGSTKERKYGKEMFGRKGGSIKKRVGALKDLLHNTDKKLGGGASLGSGLGLRHGAVRVKGGILHGGDINYVAASKSRHPLKEFIEPTRSRLISNNRAVRSTVHSAAAKELKSIREAYTLKRRDIKDIKKWSKTSSVRRKKEGLKLSKNAREAYRDHKGGAFSKNYRTKATKHFGEMRARYLKNPDKYGKRVANYAAQGSTPIALSTSKPFVALTPTEALTTAEKNTFSKATKKAGAAPYNTTKAVWSGVKKALLPTIRRRAKKGGPVCISGQHCGTLPNEGAKSVGRGLKGNNLPTEQLSNKAYKIQGVSNKPALLKQMSASFKTGVKLRGGLAIGAGLGAMALSRAASKKKK